MSASSSSKKNPARELITVGGLTPFTTIDYPGQLAAVLFLQGCPWRCHYCHNGELISRRHESTVSWRSVMDFLKRRKTLIDAVVFSGGEPTLQSGLGTAIQLVKDMGFKTGLHTAGIYPERLEKLWPLLDWVGLDIKAPVQQYAQVTGVKHSGERAWQSARLIVESGLDYEVRTTVHPRLIDRARLYELIDQLVDLQVENYVIQECVSTRCVNPDYRSVEPFPISALEIKRIARHFPNFDMRMAH